MTERFHDQFSPMMIYENMPWSVAESTVIRLPLSSKCIEDGVEPRLTWIFDKFMEHASKPILFLMSILQVTPVFLIVGYKYGKRILQDKGAVLRKESLA